MTKHSREPGALQLGDLLRYNAQYFPENVALRLDGREVTQAQLLVRVQSIRRQLSLVVGPGERIALWFQNSLNWLASFIAINDLGAVSVPINTRLTATELAIILRDVQPKALITTQAYRGLAYQE